ncbi:angio-associated migratory cell protein [Aricia agestis]|uniref:angio-associated migratory cell protein n=1 Tax=Aricia agestis TaxID=91739 RepID=UPI001C2070A6|nr:angio-associated migratory cell protein [Aricia agestis]
MKDIKADTPPSSINGDEIGNMEDEDGVIYFDEIEEIQFDEEDMEEIMDQEAEEIEMEKPEDQALLVFEKHTGSVFCCDLHPNGKLAVSGGEDDKAYVWSVENGEIVMDCPKHKDSVIFTGFSFDGAYLATIDMTGVIKVWKCQLEDNQQGPWPLAFEYEADETSWGLWHFAARVLICGGESGNIYVIKIPSGETKVLQGHTVAAECGKLFKDGKRLAVGYEDGSVKVWDLRNNTALQTISSSIHQSRITAVDTHPDNNLMASISADGTVVLSTSTNGKIVAQFEAEKELETVAFSPDPQLGLLALATLTGSVSIWDTSRQMLRHHCSKVEEDKTGGVTKMLWVKDQLVTGCLNGSVRVYNGRSGEKSFGLTGHWSEILDLIYNEKENILLTASDDKTARIFKFGKVDDKD